MTRRATTTLITALLHASFAALCWTWFDFPTAFTTPETAYLVAGALLLGALPTALHTAKRLLAPVVVVASLFTLSAYGTWSLTSAGLTPVDPTPFGWYLFGWPVVAAAALLVGGVEYGRWQYRGVSAETNGTGES